MNAAERRATAGLAAVFALRMFGLFLVLPVFALYADELAGSTPMLIGLAIGIYGLTQACLQIPLGIASDRLGRRPVIVAGLLLFGAGSVMAAQAESIHVVIIGRALQGAGAIAAAVMALAADLTRDTQRTKIMAGIGMSIGASFLLALMLGPVLAAYTGLSGLFWFSAVLALGGVGLMFTVVPVPEHREMATGPVRAQMRGVLADRNLGRLALGIFVLHLILTATFVVLPILLSVRLELPGVAHWRVYVPVLLLSVLVMVPVLAFGERRGAMHRLLAWVALALAGAVALLALSADRNTLTLLAGLWLYFAAFNILEASLPSLVSRYAPTQAKGTALGMYSTSQFLGAFVGGVTGGLVQQRYGVDGVFWFCALAAVIWFFAARGLTAPPDRTSI